MCEICAHNKFLEVIFVSKGKFYKKLGALVSTLLMGASFGGGFSSFAMTENVEERIDVENIGNCPVSRFFSVSAEDLYTNNVVYIGYETNIIASGLQQEAPAKACVNFILNNRQVQSLTLEGKYGDFFDYKLGDDPVKKHIEKLNKELESLWKNAQNKNDVENQHTEIIKESYVDLKVLQQDKKGGPSLNTVKVENAGDNLTQNEQSGSIMNTVGTFGLPGGAAISALLLCKFLL